MRTSLAVLAALALLGSSTFARGEHVQGSRSELLRETRHLVDVRVSRGHAELTVRRTVFNGGPRHDQALFWMDVPAGAVATRLRTLGERDGRPFWFEGDLMEAEAAAAKYRELTGIGGYYPKDPALLSWRSQGVLALQVFPVAPSQPKTVEYTLQVPTIWRDGREVLELTHFGTEELPPSLLLRGDRESDVLYVGDRRVPQGTSIRLTDPEGVTVSLARPSAPRVDGALAVVPFAQGRVLSHLRFAAAAHLSEVPRGASVVIALDVSRSLGDDVVEAERAAALAVLSHFPDGRVSILPFSRRVDETLATFRPASVARAALGTLPLSTHNGSALDAVLARADALLASAPAGARRLVVFTDLRTRQALTPEVARAAMPLSHALVHVAVVSTDAPSLERDDASPWDALTRPSGGLVWSANASPEADSAQDMRRVYEELARPVRLDHLRVTLPSVDADTLSAPEVLAEGQAFEDLRITTLAAPWARLQGDLWVEHVDERASPDEAEGRRWSALVFGSDLLSELSEPEMMTLALRGRAVSPVTSYLAIEPGVRPSTEGLEEEAVGFGSGSGGLGVGRGVLYGSTRVSSQDRGAYLAAALGERWRACGGTGPLRMVVETTVAEVVEVAVPPRGATADHAEQCLEEATWALDLPGFFEEAWQRFEVAL